MSSVAIDTSVLLAIFKGEPKGQLWLDALQTAAETASLLLSSVVLAEIRSFFQSEETCRAALHHLDVRHSPFTEEASLLAGCIFRKYRDEGGPRKTILPDFLIAAHASAQADMLATEDRGYLRAYFPDIHLMSPSASD